MDSCNKSLSVIKMNKVERILKFYFFPFLSYCLTELMELPQPSNMFRTLKGNPVFRLQSITYHERNLTFDFTVNIDNIPSLKFDMSSDCV